MTTEEFNAKLDFANEKMTALTARMFAILAELSPEEVVLLTTQPDFNQEN